MKFVYHLYVTLRLLLAVFFFVFFWAACHYHLSWESAWVPLEAVAILVTAEECLALLMMRGSYWSGYFKVHVETSLPTIVFESDRTFIEVLCAVAAGVLAIALGDTGMSSRVLAKASLAACVLLCFLYLNLQGASVKEDLDVGDKHEVKLETNRSPYLLMLRNFVYWTFFYGLIYIVVTPATHHS
jgi:hypothetical protein